MATFREVWAWSSSSGSQWTEVLHCEYGSISDAAHFSPEFLQYRLALASDQCTLKKIRVSDVNQPRVSVQIPINRPGLSTVVADEEGKAVVCNLASTAVPSSRRYYIRGVPQNACSRAAGSGADQLTAKFLKDLNLWFKTLCPPNNNYVVLPIAKVGTNGIVQVRCLSIDGTAGEGQSTITCDANAGLQAGNFVIISQASKKLLPGLNGVHQVVAVNGNNVTINYVTPGNAEIKMNTGKLKKRLYLTGAVLNLDACGWLFTHVRKTRNFTSHSRGARRAERLRSTAS